MMAKEASTAPTSRPLAEGLLFERRLFHAMFATDDQKEGMKPWTVSTQTELEIHSLRPV
jgi:hypothetical protein